MNICVIFKVAAAREGGGQVLGGEPFRRGSGLSYTADLFSSTVNGSVRLTANASLEVPVADDGTLAAVSETGTIDLSKGGTVRILGGAVRPTTGRYVLVPASKLAAPFDLAKWTVEQIDVKGRRAVTLAIDNGALVADVALPGLTLIVR